MFFLLILAANISFAQASDSAANAAPKPEKFITKHSIKIDNKVISYTATVGTIILKNEKG